MTGNKFSSRKFSFLKKGVIGKFNFDQLGKCSILDLHETRCPPHQKPISTHEQCFIAVWCWIYICPYLVWSTCEPLHFYFFIIFLYDQTVGGPQFYFFVIFSWDLNFSFFNILTRLLTILPLRGNLLLYLIWLD